MTRSKDKARLEEVKALLAEDRDFLRPLVQAVLQELLEAEMTEKGAEKGERTPRDTTALEKRAHRDEKRPKMNLSAVPVGSDERLGSPAFCGLPADASAGM